VKPGDRQPTRKTISEQEGKCFLNGLLASTGVLSGTFLSLLHFPPTFTSFNVYSYVCMHVHSVCVCVCVCERERERERECVYTCLHMERPQDNLQDLVISFHHVGSGIELRSSATAFTL
jgi:hypothetical protein